MKTKFIISAGLGTILACTNTRAALTRYVDLPPGEYVRVSGLSADGSTVLVSNPYVLTGWLWRDATGFVKLPDAVYPRHGGVSHDGSFVVGGMEGSGAFRMRTDTMQPEYPPSNTPDAQALAISPDGETVLYTSSLGTFLWTGGSETRIADFNVESGRISDDASVVGLASGYWAGVWTPAAGVQRLNTYYVREVSISSDGKEVLAFNEYGRSSELCSWKIAGAGALIEDMRFRTDCWAAGGASPDCSIIGLYSNSFSFDPFPPITVWTRENGLGTFPDFLQERGASLPGLNSLPGLEAMSAGNRIFAGTADFNARDYSTIQTKLWLVDLDRSCPGDLTFDALVDDADFVVFVDAYNAYGCPEESPFGCDADLDHNGFVDDSDFVLFAGAYDRLICP